MPRDIQSQVHGRHKRDYSDFLKHVEKVEKKAPRRKPVRTQPEVMVGTLFAKRNTRLSIREAALRSVSIVITYVKITTGERKKYEVNPIEIKYRKLKKGFRKVLYAEDKAEKKQIKCFVLGSIQHVAITDRKFKSEYPVLIK